MQECHETYTLSISCFFVTSSLVAVCPVQLARHNKELSIMLKPGGASGEGDEALEFYAKHTAQIEVTTHNPCHISQNKLII